MNTSVWPSDYLLDPQDIERENANQLIVFLASPFNERYDEIHEVCQFACEEIAKNRHIQIDCHRADYPATPIVIHNDIWNYIQNSDSIIVDISERNPNVMIELGVAMTLRKKTNVIIIQDTESEGENVFDISPDRYLLYHRKIIGDSVFYRKLIKALEFSLAPAPYIPRSLQIPELPIKIDIADKNTFDYLVSPPNAHRRIINEGLEFGSFYFFQYSWLTLGMNQYSKIKVQLEMKFSDFPPEGKQKDSWVGIMLRSKHFYANYGHLIYIKVDGTIVYAMPLNENGGYEDVQLGMLNNFNPNQLITFNLLFNDKIFGGSINEFKFENSILEMPFVYNAGLIRLQSYLSRGCVRTLSIENES